MKTFVRPNIFLHAYFVRTHARVCANVSAMYIPSASIPSALLFLLHTSSGPSRNLWTLPSFHHLPYGDI